MTRALLPLALLAAGCVPVYEPVGDVDKSAPDKGLVGKWKVTKSRGTANLLFGDAEAFAIDAPVVKGNPKGLMRAAHDGKTLKVVWFYPAAVGKGTYASCLLTADDVPPLETEGEFAKWKKGERRYFVLRYVLDGDALTVDCGSHEAARKALEAAEFESHTTSGVTFYKNSAGWLDKYLEKPGPDKLFDGTSSLTLKRQK